MGFHHVDQDGLKLLTSGILPTSGLPHSWDYRHEPLQPAFMIFKIVFLFSILFISALIFVISFLLLDLGSVCS